MKKQEDHNHPLVEKTAARLTQVETTCLGKLERLFLFIRNEIRVQSPNNGDLVNASETITMSFRQCNTKATLLLALCNAVGLPARIHFSP